MPSITIANHDWQIVDDLVTALAGAMVDAESVFANVTVTTADRQAKGAQLTGRQPKAIVRYVDTHVTEAPDGQRECALSVELTIAVKIHSGPDETPRLREILRLVNAARNAIEASPPAAARYWGDGARWHNKLEWGPPAIDAAEAAPWAIAVLPLAVGYALDSPTGH